VRVLTTRSRWRDTFFVPTRRMGKHPSNGIQHRKGILARRIWAGNCSGGRKGEQHEGVIVEIACQIDRPVIKIEAQCKTTVLPPGRATQKLKAERNSITCSRHAECCGICEYVRLPASDAQTTKISRALQRRQVQMLVKGTAFPIHAALEPKGPSMVSKPLEVQFLPFCPDFRFSHVCAAPNASAAGPAGRRLNRCLATCPCGRTAGFQPLDDPPGA
jgi:hypothetical protein